MGNIIVKCPQKLLMYTGMKGEKNPSSSLHTNANELCGEGEKALWLVTGLILVYLAAI